MDLPLVNVFLHISSASAFKKQGRSFQVKGGAEWSMNRDVESHEPLQNPQLTTDMMEA